ncbi:DUF2797 domain-containing protein [Halieaceae bacterium IMCC14734]|uniref:DUF2797 domain-containing protein n=2 Tax=Candidatus Litorirhabdus singularis TaxID=2518993 RepID=A0ABT3TIR7_9GAMM|nr:DUF2797 domain-containing protein [Candidatus Litorirhabdus singularis]MCX2981695.1 DUF2797 domain-containing protein [Candidatus Litorirhabdus singularis]
MLTKLESPVQYALQLGEQEVDMNALLGEQLELEHLGAINCVSCDRLTKKSFNQGYCYPCFTRLASCDSCIMSPEKCHYAAGTCREPEWGERNCMTDHFVYLANSSGVKVGITRGNQIPTRWMDQGAVQALPVFRVATRLLSGLVETVYKQHIADKTNWRAMLKGDVEDLDLTAVRDTLAEQCAAELAGLQDTHGLQSITALTDESQIEIAYPVIEHPVKVTSFNLDKQPLVTGKLMGIKGQYLIFDGGVINLRKYGGYQLELRQL